MPTRDRWKLANTILLKIVLSLECDFIFSLYLPMGVTLFWSSYKISHVTAHLFNYLILNSKVLFGEDTLDWYDLSQSYFYLPIEVCWHDGGKNKFNYRCYYYSWSYGFTVVGAAYHFKYTFLKQCSRYLYYGFHDLILILQESWIYPLK